MSGGGRQKGDYSTGRFRVEDKVTAAQSYTLKRAVLDKIESEALRTPPGLLPQMRITIAGRTYRLYREEDAVALGFDDLKIAN